MRMFFFQTRQSRLRARDRYSLCIYYTLYTYLCRISGGLVEIPSYVITWYAMDRLGRRWVLCLTMLLGGLACVSCMFVPEGNENFAFLAFPFDFENENVCVCVSHDRRRMGDGVTGHDREIRYRRLVRRVLRVRRGIVADRVEVASDGDCLVHSWHRSPRFPVHRPSGGLLESPAADHNGHAERGRRPHLHLPSRNAQHPFASNDRGRRVVRRRFQALVLSNVAKVDFFTTSLLKLFIYVVSPPLQLSLCACACFSSSFF